VPEVLVMPSGWRMEARRVIERAVAESAGKTTEETVQAIDAAYPFGPREHWPYKAWLAERRRALALLRGETLTYDESKHPQPPPFVPDPALEEWAARAGRRAVGA
jgi:hypothetical protein